MADQKPEPANREDALQSRNTVASGRKLAGLTVGSVGIVYGDIGTSPLYAFREALSYASADGLQHSEILGVASLIIWALTLVVTCKYVVLILQLDNHGEGGILSLLALVQRIVGRKLILTAVAIFGASLFFGDAVITPAISVLSAVEGLKVVQPGLENLILPITTLVLIGVFWLQKHGTASVALWFGPIMTFWFATLAVMGVYWIARSPEILLALSPSYAVGFLLNHTAVALTIVGLVFLAVTGAEALYTDLGHFGRKPIQLAWLFFVFPALALNYLGQGALVLARPEASADPFFLMAPAWGLVPLVILSTIATIIASQAVISGAFSMTRQAIQLGLLPRLDIRHTSALLQGQIYIPAINWLLFAGVIGLVWSFRSSSALASAYGIAVSGDMIVTTSLAFVALWKFKKLPVWQAFLIVLPFALVELVFVTANSMKIADGGYVPLMIAISIAIVMLTWVRGRQIVSEKTHNLSIELVDVVEMLSRSAIGRVKGTAVYMAPVANITPTALLHNFKHNNIIHQQNVIATVEIENVPRISARNRIRFKKLNDEFSSIVISCGYMETPNIPRALQACSKHGIKSDAMLTSYFLSKRTITPATTSTMPKWQTRLFVLLTRLASRATDYYRIPPDRVIELGQQIAI
jgi:KUP system potassium uptake protein